MNGIQSILQATRRGAGSLKIVMATGLFKTAAGVVDQRSLQEEATGLRAYLALQLRSARQAVDALQALQETLEQGSAKELAEAPSRRAGIYLAARNQVAYDRLFGDATAPPPPLSSAPFDPCPPGRPQGWAKALEELRFGITGEEAELLELHHVRRLEGLDLAYVMGVDVATVERRLEAAQGFARLLLRDRFRGELPDLSKLLTDAYAVLPPGPEEEAAAKAAKVVAPLPNGTVIGERYELVESIGGGEFAYVYRARDIRVPGHVVALKLLHRRSRTEAAREGAIRELSLIASAFHPSLVQFKDHGWFEDRLWFVMPFYIGAMLLDRLEKGPLPVDEAFDHFERLARGLQALHEAGIRHQDIKPENIFLVELSTGSQRDRPEILPVLLDLGVATPNGENALAGTPMYFPPEVAARIFDEDHPVPLTPQADVFALALSLLHSIEDPDLSELEGVSVETFLERRAETPPPGPRLRRHAYLKRPFARWLARDPGDRPTAGELAEELATLRRRARRPASSLGLRGAVTTLAFAGALAAAVALGGAREAPLPPAGAPAGSPTRPDLEATSRLRMLTHRLDEEAARVTSLERALGRLRLENHLQEVEVEDAQEREAEAITGLAEARAEVEASEAARDAALAQAEAARADLDAALARVARAEGASEGGGARAAAAEAGLAAVAAREADERLSARLEAEAQAARAAQAEELARLEAAAAATEEAEAGRRAAEARAEVEAQRARETAEAFSRREAQIREEARTAALAEAERRRSAVAEAELAAARAAAAQAERLLADMEAAAAARVEQARTAALATGGEEAALAAQEAAQATEVAAEGRIRQAREAAARDLVEVQDQAARALAELEERAALELARARGELARVRREVATAREEVAAATTRAAEAQREARRVIREVREQARAQERIDAEELTPLQETAEERRRRLRREERRRERRERRREELRAFRAVLRELRSRRVEERQQETGVVPRNLVDSIADRLEETGDAPRPAEGSPSGGVAPVADAPPGPAVRETRPALEEETPTGRPVGPEVPPADPVLAPPVNPYAEEPSAVEN